MIFLYLAVKGALRDPRCAQRLPHGDFFAAPFAVHRFKMCIRDRCEDVPEEYRAVPILSGDIHVHPRHMDYWLGKLRGYAKGRDAEDCSADIIGLRAAQELRRGDIINIGIGIPEKVGTYASRRCV